MLLWPSIDGASFVACARAALAKSALLMTGWPVTRNTASSVMSESTVSTSPALLADIHVETSSRISSSSFCIAKLQRPARTQPQGHGPEYDDDGGRRIADRTLGALGRPRPRGIEDRARREAQHQRYAERNEHDVVKIAE